jgi:two-component system sensor histidine kinase GlrK
VKRLQPPTLLRLILLGFVIVSLPLVVAIVTAIQQLDGFARDNRQALMAVQENASTSRALADRVRELERTARQYQGLGDSTLMDLYEEHRAEVLAMFAQLSAAQTNDELQLRLVQAEGLRPQPIEWLVVSVPTQHRSNWRSHLRRFVTA